MAMVTVIRTNNIVSLSFAEAVLKDADVLCFIADQHTSVIEGSVGVIPRRLMVLDEDEYAARVALSDAGLAAELTDG